MIEPMGNGFYRTEMNKATWEVPERYKELQSIGSGAYGLVCSAVETEQERKVAIKKFSRPFQSLIHAKRTYREIKLLRHMDHENIIGILDIFTPQQSIENFQDVYMVTQLMGADLNSILKCQQLSDDHVKFLIYQILRGLKYIHSAGVIHRDLKPSNIAVNEDCELRILDFGLARMADNEMTGYVATRWYRAPEIMLNWMHYNQTVDIWSVGCIMAELLTSKTLFPGTDHIDQLTRILKLVGKPDTAFLSKISSETARNYVAQMQEFKKKPFRDVFTGASDQAVDLLEQMLKLDADTRITAEAALDHPYLEIYADHDDEPVCDTKFDEPPFQSDDIDFWRRLTFEEIVSYQSLKQPEAMET